MPVFQELKVKPLPTVLASFSGGSKGCMYKVIQVCVCLVLSVGI
jgi:hypothetical protein